LNFIFLGLGELGVANLPFVIGARLGLKTNGEVLPIFSKSVSEKNQAKKGIAPYSEKSRWTF
jgi:hypothetical protein